MYLPRINSVWSFAAINLTDICGEHKNASPIPINPTLLMIPSRPKPSDPNIFSILGSIFPKDVFILSNGHLSPVWYSVLARSGYFNISELATFRKIGTNLQGHPATAEGLPGVRIASGSLGQGMSVAIGTALAKKLNGDSHLVYSLHGDGELQEGQNWEAMMFAAHHKVDNLIATLDHNGLQIDGSNDEVLSLGDIKAKWHAFGWKVLEMNGNKMEEVLNTLKKAKKETGKGMPVVIIMKTEMGYPIDFMLNDCKWHGVPPNDEELEKALAQLPETLGDY